MVVGIRFEMVQSIRSATDGCGGSGGATSVVRVMVSIPPWEFALEWDSASVICALELIAVIVRPTVAVRVNSRVFILLYFSVPLKM